MTETLTSLEGQKMDKMAVTEGSDFLKHLNKDTQVVGEEEDEEAFYRPVTHNHLKQGREKKCAGVNSATLCPGGQIAHSLVDALERTFSLCVLMQRSHNFKEERGREAKSVRL